MIGIGWGFTLIGWAHGDGSTRKSSREAHPDRSSVITSGFKPQGICFSPVPRKADSSRRKPGARNDNSCAIFNRERRSGDTGRNELPRAKSLQNATLYMPSKCYVAFVNTKACQAPQRCICHPNALKTLIEFFEKQSEGKPLKCDIMYLVESEKARCLFRLFLFLGLV